MKLQVRYKKTIKKVKQNKTNDKWSKKMIDFYFISPEANFKILSQKF